MHGNNFKALDDMQKSWPDAFSARTVLELGSGGVDRSFRDGYFTGAIGYIGVDIVAGVNVDVVAPAATLTFPKESFDTIISFSMLEHDPDWRNSILHNIPSLKKGGYLLMCWGAEGNLHHGPEPWALVPAMDVLEALRSAGMTILDSFFEEHRYGPDCVGAFDVVARR